jgi:hypothetical protein
MDNLYFELDDWAPDDAEDDYPVPLEARCPMEEIFSRSSFQAGNLPTDKEVPLSAEDKQWLAQKATTPENTSPPPSYAAERFFKSQLDRFNFVMPASQEQWQNYVMYKYFELSLDPDPKISKPALDSLAKSSVVGLATEKTEININTMPTADLEKELLSAIKRFSGEKVIEGKAERV